MRYRRAAPGVHSLSGVNPSASDLGPSADELSLRTAPMPRVLWIELTSRCPFDCVFCSRKLLRGNGSHMPFPMYRRLLEELSDPAIIRLNYSGESVHHPQLVEACQLAAGTGAQVELVTALAALPVNKVDPLVASGLSRLTVSLHTLDAEAFKAMYRFSTVDALTSRLERVVQLTRSNPNTTLRTVDLAFVAMRRNLSQLPAVAEYATRLGITRLAVHPIIRRDPIDEQFVEELDGDRLRPEFLADLERSVAKVRSAHPQLSIEFSTPESATPKILGAQPAYFSGKLPNSGVRISGCDQDPFETIHILSDGRVVTCEVRDQIVLGTLVDSTLSNIWHNEKFRSFRQQHTLGRDPHCRACPYKRAHTLTQPATRVRPGVEGDHALIAGWHEVANEQLAWSAPIALMRLRAVPRGGMLRVRGMLPDGGDQRNALTISIGGAPVLRIDANRSGMLTFEIKLPVAATNDTTTALQFAVDVAYCPRKRGVNQDTRALGFALIEARLESRK